MRLKTLPIPQRSLWRVCFDWAFHEPTFASLVWETVTVLWRECWGS